MAEKKKGTSHRSDVPIILVRLALLICLRRCWTAARQDALAGLPAHEILHIHRRAGEDVINNSLDAQGAELRRADHKFFKSHGQYDFPQKKWWTSWMMYLVGGMMNNPKLKRKLGGKMSEGMIAPYKKVIDSL